jgi:broad specificity phosphatase PhoE
MTGKLILVRHSAPQVVPGTPQNRWSLSPEGHAAAHALAQRLRTFSPPVILSSPEPKALETATAIAAALGRPVQEEPDLREHDRASLGYLDRAVLEAGVAQLFTTGDELVFGDESAQAVFNRMDRAVRSAQADAAGADALLVTHGTAMAILLARRCGLDPLAFWRTLAAPAAVILDGERLEQVLQ